MAAAELFEAYSTSGMMKHLAVFWRGEFAIVYFEKGMLTAANGDILGKTTGFNVAVSPDLDLITVRTGEDPIVFYSDMANLISAFAGDPVGF